MWCEKQKWKLHLRQCITAFLCSVCLISVPKSAIAQSIRPMIPYIAVEDRNLRDFANSIIQTYLLFSDTDLGENATPSFIFISGDDYISNGKIDQSVAKRFFPGMSSEEIDHFQGESNACLVFTIPLKEVDLVVGVNSTGNADPKGNYLCLLYSVSYYLDNGSIQSRYGSNFKEYGRNIISELQERY